VVLLSIFNDFLRSANLKKLTSKKMLEFEADFPATAEQIRLLAFGAVLLSNNGESCRTFRLHVSKDSAANDFLMPWWGITCREDALEIAERLAIAGNRTSAADEAYDAILGGFIAKVNDSSYSAYLRCKSLLRSLGYSEMELLNIRTTASWDYGRTGFVARYSVKAGYLDESEGWEFMRKAADNATKAYHNWREYIAGYILGRALGYGNDSADFRVVYKYLLNNPDSPLRNAAFLV